MARPAAIAGAIVILLGGAAIGYAVTRPAPGGLSEVQGAAIASAVGQLDNDITRARAAVQERASTLSKLLPVRATIGTNAATVADQVRRGELEFAPGEGEILELAQIKKAEGGAIEELMVQPAGAMHNMHDGAPGSYADVIDHQLVITEVAEVAPKYTQDVYRGLLTVSRPVALAPALAPLLQAQLAGKLEASGKSIPIGTPPPDGAITHAQALSAQKDVKLTIAEPPSGAARPVPILGAGIGGVVIGLLLLVISLLGQRGAAARTASRALPAQPSPPSHPIGSAATQLSQHPIAAATGTPAPGGSMVAAPGDSIVASNLGPGTMIGRWEVVRRLGSGGMADVYLAQARGDGGFEKLVAIKVMHSHLARIQRAVDHFLDEARLAARIHHPNVVAIQDLGKIGTDYVIVMEYVEGVDLERLLMSARAGQRPVPIAIALGILCRICDGLDAAHRATAPDGTPLGIIHRDVKSANVLVSRQGSVKVVDFGIAKAAKQVHYTVAGETKGTPAMMAPEQRVGEQVDVRADVYSVAAVGYELVTGQAVNLDLASLAHLGVENWPHLPPPSSLRAGLPVELDTILLHAMAFERERRPADCAAFGALCEAVMKRHNLVASDKDLARWVDGELRQLSPAFVGATAGLSGSSPA
ncbi:MAG TPA: serine/threonine-protein kinase [Kofleriaceae bacterium]|nr:serine/threonine-protein kinase [Kofleriaceae bacterium]